MPRKNDLWYQEVIIIGIAALIYKTKLQYYHSGHNHNTILTKVIWNWTLHLLPKCLYIQNSELLRIIVVADKRSKLVWRPSQRDKLNRGEKLERIVEFLILTELWWCWWICEATISKKLIDNNIKCWSKGYSSSTHNLDVWTRFFSLYSGAHLILSPYPKNRSLVLLKSYWTAATGNLHSKTATSFFPLIIFIQLSTSLNLSSSTKYLARGYFDQSIMVLPAESYE